MERRFLNYLELYGGLMQMQIETLWFLSENNNIYFVVLLTYCMDMLLFKDSSNIIQNC